LKQYILEPTAPFRRDVKRLTKKDKGLAKLLDKKLEMLSRNHEHQSLLTHKIDQTSYGSIYSSRVNGDIRVLWSFDADDTIIILLLKLGGHDEVY
jgi:mRNA-degrading endonuclease YafQ of YafQ-DinJ toxin-antitoxin module